MAKKDYTGGTPSQGGDVMMDVTTRGQTKSEHFWSDLEAGTPELDTKKYNQVMEENVRLQQYVEKLETRQPIKDNIPECDALCCICVFPMCEKGKCLDRHAEIMTQKWDEVQGTTMYKIGDEMIMSLVSLLDHLSDVLVLQKWLKLGHYWWASLGATSIVLSTLVPALGYISSDPVKALAMATGFGMMALVYDNITNDVLDYHEVKEIGQLRKDYALHETQLTQLVKDHSQALDKWITFNRVFDHFDAAYEFVAEFSHIMDSEGKKCDLHLLILAFAYEDAELSSERSWVVYESLREEASEMIIRPFCPRNVRKSFRGFANELYLTTKPYKFLENYPQLRGVTSTIENLGAKDVSPQTMARSRIHLREIIGSFNEAVIEAEAPKIYKIFETGIESLPQIMLQFLYIMHQIRDGESYDPMVVGSLTISFFSNMLAGIGLLLPDTAWENLQALVYNFCDAVYRSLSLLVFAFAAGNDKGNFRLLTGAYGLLTFAIVLFYTRKTFAKAGYTSDIIVQILCAAITCFLLLFSSTPALFMWTQGLGIEIGILLYVEAFYRVSWAFVFCYAEGVTDETRSYCIVVGVTAVIAFVTTHFVNNMLSKLPQDTFILAALERVSSTIAKLGDQLDEDISGFEVAGVFTLMFNVHFLVLIAFVPMWYMGYSALDDFTSGCSDIQYILLMAAVAGTIIVAVLCMAGGGMCRCMFSVPTISVCCMTLVGAVIWGVYDYVHQDWECVVAITDAGGTLTYDTFLVLIYYFGIFAFGVTLVPSLVVGGMSACCPCIVCSLAIDREGPVAVWVAFCGSLVLAWFGLQWYFTYYMLWDKDTDFSFDADGCSDIEDIGITQNVCMSLGVLFSCCACLTAFVGHDDDNPCVCCTSVNMLLKVAINIWMFVDFHNVYGSGSCRDEFLAHPHEWDVYWGFYVSCTIELLLMALLFVGFCGMTLLEEFS